MHDLRSFLQHLSRHRQLLEIDAPVDPVLESTTLSLRALREGGPALLMNKAVGSPHAMLGNLFGHRRRIGWPSATGRWPRCTNWASCWLR